MAAKVCADIKPTGLNQEELINIVYMIITSIRGIAAKLDADASVTDTDYNANVDACFNLVINDDCRGNSLNLANTESSSLTKTVILNPYGFDRAQWSDVLYMIVNAWETLCEQLDADANPPTSTDYETDAFINIMPWSVENSKGNMVGNGTYYHRSGAFDQKHVVDALYDLVNGIETFCEQADTDAAPADSNYEALWFTANITLTVENSKGQRVGN